VCAMMAAVHLVLGRSGRRLLVMMLLDGAHALSAATGTVRRPGGGTERRIKQKNREQADDRGNGASSIVACLEHAMANEAHYIVRRHSLQANLFRKIGLMLSGWAGEQSLSCVDRPPFAHSAPTHG